MNAHSAVAYMSKALNHFKQKNMSVVTDGVFAINKPKGMSSAQVIRDCQACFNPSTMFAHSLQKEAAKREKEGKKQRGRRRGNPARIDVKMGHGGTLDPLASGVLILGVNNGTKSLSRFLECAKTYETVVVFGASSDSQDRVGKLLKKAPYHHITQDMVRDALKSYMGTIQQTPPLFSALKMNGKPLYEYAREGLPIPREIPTREVTVEEIELLEWYEPGTHRHFWPREQATQEEKEIAQRVEDALHRGKSPSRPGTVEAPLSPKKTPVKTTTTTTTPAKPEGSSKMEAFIEKKTPTKAETPVKTENTSPEGNGPRQSFTEAGEKRKADEQTAASDDKVYEAPSKRPKIQSSPVMSGALPSSSEGTPIAPTTPPAAVSTSDSRGAPASQSAGSNTTPTITVGETNATTATNPLIPKGKGSDLIPLDSPTAPPPWEDHPPGPPAAKIRLRVSSGFYVRTFCHDLGEQLGSAALMAELVRTSQAMFRLGDDVIEYPVLHEGESAWAPRVAGLLQKWSVFEKKERKLGAANVGEEGNLREEVETFWDGKGMIDHAMIKEGKSR